ncbi:MAG TPA: pitrilysin family protein [Thermoanaerobaculia bacterium]
MSVRTPRPLRPLAALLAAVLALPAAAAAQVTRAQDLRYPPLPALEIPQPQRVVLDNGIVVMLLEDHELPLIEATALVRAGSRLDPADKVGLADLAASVMRTGGTAKLPSDQLDDWLESRAVSIEVAATNDMARATLSSLKQDFPEALKVFADVLRRPAFDPARLEVARNQSIAEVSRQNDEADSILFREFQEILYGAESPFARTPTYATLGAIRRDDLAAFHRRYFQPDRIVLGLVGDFRGEDALRLVREAFGDWPRSSGAKDAEPVWRKEPSPGVYWAEKTDMTQSNVLIGHLGVRKDHPDYYALEVLNEVLSGSFASRLFSSVRTQKGLAYAVSGRVGSEWDHPGMAYLYVTTKTQTTGAAIQALLDEAKGVVSRPPTEQEVELGKQALLNSFVFNVDSPRKVLSQQLSLELYGYPLDWLSRYRAGIEAVTTAQVREAGARHLRPGELTILVVGPQEGRDRPLTDFGKVTTLDVTIPKPGAK